ncbi:MAG: Uma2 family endonuclease [Lacipirellulaceae bacterium]
MSAPSFNPDPTAPGLAGNYAWEVATFFPEQGRWSEADYLDLTDGSNRRVELIDGRLEFLPMPTEAHQQLAGFLYHALLAFVSAHRLGKVPYASIRLRVRPDKVREPDVLFLSNENLHLRHNRVWDGADLVMEVVSGDAKDRQRDYEAKAADYAGAGVREYWIVDHPRRCVVVHRLDGAHYAVAGTYTDAERAASVLLEGFAIDVAALFQAADDVPE